MTDAHQHPDQDAERRAQAAERQRRRRERRAAGVCVVPVETDVDTIESLVQRGWLAREDATDQSKVALALSMLLEAFLETSGVTRDAPAEARGKDAPDQ